MVKYLQKQTETFEDQENKQVRAFEEHKQIAEYNVTKTDSNHNLGGLLGVLLYVGWHGGAGNPPPPLPETC